MTKVRTWPYPVATPAGAAASKVHRRAQQGRDQPAG